LIQVELVKQCTERIELAAKTLLNLLSAALLALFMGCADSIDEADTVDSFIEDNVLRCAHHFQINDKATQGKIIRLLEKINSESDDIFHSKPGDGFSFFLVSKRGCDVSYELIQHIYPSYAPQTKEILRKIPQERVYLVMPLVNVENLERILLRDKEIRETLPIPPGAPDQ